MNRHPIQPVETVDGVQRFKGNAIVRWMLDLGYVDLNKIAVTPFSQEDREQFAQLIGYSLSGFSELSYVSDETYAAACAMAENPEVSPQDARIATLEEKIAKLRVALRGPIADLYGIHPDDLLEEPKENTENANKS